MRSPLRVLSFLLLLAAVVTRTSLAQPVPAPFIQSVTVNADTSVITITGSGLGPDVLVTVDGQPVALLPGATATRVEIQAPATVLSTPGTYRLTLTDSLRRVGDAFIIASLGGVPGSATPVAGSSDRVRPNEESSPLTARATGSAPPRAAAAAASTTTRPLPMVTENSLFPYLTAIGAWALANNTSGFFNTASGFQALEVNTSGTYNTATGVEALQNNTSGSYNTATGALALNRNTADGNTATGYNALFFNTTANGNTATGYYALFRNTAPDNTAMGFQALENNGTGVNNTATGVFALKTNTIGSYNVAVGGHSLLANTTGSENAAVGTASLFANTTGSENAASGAWALYSNTGGFHNTATGAYALYANTTGNYNAASGNRALASNTTGYYNTADGVESLSSNTTGFKNTASGLWALLSNTTGGQNTAVGFNAGANVTTGAYNVYVGADVTGTAADTNTIRIGLPYNGGVGQNQTFIAGIHGTQLTGPAVQVFIDANGRLGTLTAPLVSGTGTVAPMASPPQVQEQRATIEALRRQVEDQQKTNAELRARLARLETLVASAGSRK